MKTMSQKERRRAPRTTLKDAFMDIYSIDTRYLKEYKGRIFDISTLGVKFTSNKPYNKYTEVHVGLLLPNYNSLIKVIGRVVRCEDKSNEDYHIAVEFKEDTYQQRIINEYIEVMKLWDKQLEIHKN